VVLIGIAFFYFTIFTARPTSVTFASEIPSAVPDNYQYAILLNNSQATFCLDGQKIEMPVDSVGAYLKTHLHELKMDETLHIIVGKDVAYKNVVGTLDLMAINRIHKYSLINQ